MNTSKISSLLTIAALAMFSACTVSKTPTPSLQGPSGLGRALVITASPDVLSMDGASQSLITIEARDENGQTVPNVQLRVEIRANGQFVDFGTLSARTVVTNAAGRATVVYTAPVGSSGAIPSLDIYVTPSGTDTNSGFPTSQFIAIRLVPPGVIIPGGATPSFTVTPGSPAAFQDTVFDASASTPGLSGTIVSYAWNFGDGATATGVQVTHRFSASNTYHVTLAITDSNGITTTKAQDVTVGSGTDPIAEFTFSPQTPGVNETINFNGGPSKAGAGASIVRYDWDFGSGSNQSGVTVSKAYDVAGAYNVVLTVTDSNGQRAQITHSVTVTAGTPNAVISFSPGSPNPTTVVHFNSDGTTYFSGATAGTFAWNFGDGSTSTLANPDHPYAAVGSYNVRLTVVDSKGRSGTTTTPVNVVAVAPPASPIAAFTYSPNPPPAAPVVVSFDAGTSQRPSGAAITNYRWNFGDNTAIVNTASATVTHNYTTSGAFTVSLVVTDANAQTGSTTQTVTVP